MNLHQINFEATKRFSSTFLQYLNNTPELAPFYNEFPAIENFGKIIENRNYNDEIRTDLVEALQGQYQSIKSTPEVQQNIELLANEKTFTITTGHQLNILTGPLFFIYKIISAINLSAELKAAYPDYNFVPVYWMASEDHDFDEIRSFRLFGQKFQWEKEASGAVGELECSSLASQLDQLNDIPEFICEAYRSSKNLSEATIKIVNELFGKYGLVILDANRPALKKHFKKEIQDDLFNQAAGPIAKQTTEKLENLGYKGQIFPRDINLFYMEEGVRERIESEGGKFKVLNTNLAFDEKELENLIQQHPERFSPNVVLRPVFQEVILPNLAYIGGPAEMAYWLQLKDVFAHYQVPFPMLVPRLFGMIIPKNIMKTMMKIGLQLEDLFEDFAALKTRIAGSDENENTDLTSELSELRQVFDSIKSKAGNVDKSLEGFVMGEFKKAEKGVENIQKRLKKSEEQKHEVAINQLKKVIDKLFPNGNLQEREDNFLNFYINNPFFIQELFEKLSPLQFRFNMLTEDD